MSQELLPLGPEPQTVRTVSSAFTPPLKDLLRQAVDAKDAARLVLASPWALDECRRMNDVVQRLAGPCGPEAVYVALQPCLILYDTPDFGDSDGLHVAWITIYQNALKHLPKESLEHAVSHYIANAKRPFFPKPSELNEIAGPHSGSVGQLAWRCAQAVKIAAEAQRGQESPEERERGRQLVAETLAALRTGGGLKAFPTPPRPTQSRADAAEEFRRAAR